MMHAFPFEMGPGDDAGKLEAMLQEYADAYVQFVHEQLAKHIDPNRGAYFKTAVAISLMHSAALVATSLTSAVWSANAAKRLDQAGNN